MTIILKNKHSLKIDSFNLNVVLEKMGLVKKKLREIIKLLKVVFEIEKLYYRGDRLNKPFTKLKCIKINKTMGWCNDVKDKTNYNKLVDTKKKIKIRKTL